MTSTHPVVLLVGIGGATCSGKTTLAKHLKQILPDSVIIHQDPQELIPIHPIHKVQDWDAAPGAIDWPKLVNFLRAVKETGEIPLDHRSHDHLNQQSLVEVDDEVKQELASVFQDIKRKQERQGGRKIIWGLVDGFLLYWNKDVIDQLDVRIFLRVPHDVLKKRRLERHGYHTAVQFDPEGTLWRDPPGYWEQIVYPAYVDAHQEVFQNGNVEKGEAGSKVEDLVVLDILDMEMKDILKRCCQVLKEVV